MSQSSRAKSSRSGDSGTIPAIRNRSLTVSHRKYCCAVMKFQGCGQLGLGALSRLVVVSDRKSHITIQQVVSKLGHVPWDILVIMSKLILAERNAQTKKHHDSDSGSDTPILPRKRNLTTELQLSLHFRITFRKSLIC